MKSAPKQRIPEWVRAVRIEGNPDPKHVILVGLHILSKRYEGPPAQGAIETGLAMQGLKGAPSAKACEPLQWIERAFS